MTQFEPVKIGAIYSLVSNGFVEVTMYIYLQQSMFM